MRPIARRGVLLLLALAWWTSPPAHASARLTLSTTAPLLSEALRTNRESVTSPATNAIPAQLPQHLRHGFELAHVYCQACHLFPEPQYLTQDAWVNGALRLMALRLGTGKLNYDKNPDGPILKQAGVFPNEPLISRDDWFDICQYYRQSAPVHPLPQPPRAPIRSGLRQFAVKPIRSQHGEPWTTLTRIVPSQRRFYLGDAAAKTLDVFDPKGVRTKSIPLESGPVSLLFRGNDAYVTLIGKIFPSDQLAGSVALIQDLAGTPQVRTFLNKLRRPTDLLMADLNADGHEDLVLCEYGNILGQFSWLENRGQAGFDQHVLLDRPGAILAYACDLNNDGLPDLVVQTAQAREGIFLFQNMGKGVFTTRPLVEYPPFWGSSHFELVDFNHDGFLDLLVTNGDSGDYVSPTKSFHGIRLYLNDTHGQFNLAWFYPLNGAYKAVAADFDGDGDLDIAAISFYPDYLHSPEESFVYLQNQGGLHFDAYTIPEHTLGRWLTMDVGDLDGDGDLDIVLGSFANGPPSIPIPTALRESWRTNGISALLLENLRR